MKSPSLKEPSSESTYLGGKLLWGGVVTTIPIEVNADGSVRTKANLIKQYQLIPFEILRREAYKCYVGDLVHSAPLSTGPDVIRQLDPENNLTDRATFYKQVDAKVI